MQKLYSIKMYMCITYRNSIARCVTVEDEARRKLYIIKNQYAQVHIRNQSQAK